VPEGGLGKGERQVLAGNLMVGANESTLQHGPEGVEVGRVDDAASVLTFAVLSCL
jgi:hypothetical protein